ncbi:MAG: nucleotidyl transferase AbiEii/AbiGii toxin family protein [Bacteroidales bacterium]|jgi:hypothetical protein|nr:nucleotidyl transferase AbiEii/AbiGii toxin family protein [Bacteroidales bacterium]
MIGKLHYQTISESIRKILPTLMDLAELQQFRLVGGTALSLQLGHRQSVDIDLFTGSAYGSVDYQKIDATLREIFGYVDTNTAPGDVPGLMYFIGNTPETAIKLDLFYTDTFMFPAIVIDGIRMVNITEIGTMKLELISRGGRKKDFWDIIEIQDHIPFKELMHFSLQKYSYLTKKALRKGLKDFSKADDEVNPMCLRGRYWELVKADIVELANTI